MLKKIASIVLIMMITLTGVAYAEVSDQALLRLSGLGIMTGDENGDFRLEDNITRAEFAAIISRLNGIDSLQGQETAFSDVPKDHWASGYIASAYTIGIVSGIGENLFAPDNNISYTDAAKMLVSLLGYDVVAQTLGGYPTGYLSQANVLGLFKRVDSNGSAAMRGEIAAMVNNALDVFPLERGYGSNADTFTKKDQTLYDSLADRKNSEIIQFKGILRETEYSSLNRTTPSVRSGRYVIEDEIYFSETNFNQYLGYYVEGYATAENSELTILNLLPVTRYNNQTIIPSEDGEWIDSYIRTYDEKGTEIKIEVNPDAIYLYNGRLLENPTGEEKQVTYGSYRLLDNDGDEVADVVFLEEAESFIIERIHTENSALYFADNLLYRGKKGFTFSWEDKNKKYFLQDSHGNELEFSDIRENDAITFFASRDNENLVTAVISDEVVTGVVDAIEDGKIFSIDGQPYKTAANSKVKISLGDEATYLLDALGNIVGLDGEKQAIYHFGYIVGGQFSSNLDKKLELKIITSLEPEKSVRVSAGTETISYYLQNDAAKRYFCADKIRFSMDELNTGGNTVTTANLNPLLLEGKIVRFTLNQENRITQMNVYSVGGTDKLDFNAKIISFGGERVSRGYATTSSTKIICVPQTVRSEEDYNVRLRITDKDSYDVYGLKAVLDNPEGSYKANAEPVDVLILKADMDSSQSVNIQHDNDICMVGSVTQVLGEGSDEGELVYKIELLNDDKKESRVTAAYGDGFFEAADLRMGDLIQYAVDGKGKIANIKKLGSSQGLKTYTDLGDIYGMAYDVEYQMFDYLSNQNVDLLTVSFGENKDNKEIRVFLDEKQPIYLYNRRLGYIDYAGTEDIVAYNQSGSGASKIFALMEGNDALAIVIIND